MEEPVRNSHVCNDVWPALGCGSSGSLRDTHVAEVPSSFEIVKS